MTEPVRVSPSQLVTFNTCQRLWGFTYLLGLRSPATRSTALGTAVHEVHEAYLKHGTAPDPDAPWYWEDEEKAWYPGKIALSMMGAHYPRPGSGTVEGQFEWDWDGIRFNGLIDWRGYDELIPLSMQPEPFHSFHGAKAHGLINIIDHKTSVDPRKWGKSPEALETDPQWLIYTRYLLSKHNGSGNVHGVWNYGGTDASPSKAIQVHVYATPGNIYAHFENSIMPVAREIKRLKLANPPPLDLPYNASACNLYHRPCPHINTCNLTSSQRLGAFMSSTSLLDKLVTQAQTTTAAARPNDQDRRTMVGVPPQPPKAAGDVVNPLDALVQEITPNAQAPAPQTPAAQTTQAPAVTKPPNGSGLGLDVEALLAATAPAPASEPELSLDVTGAPMWTEPVAAPAEPTPRATTAWPAVAKLAPVAAPAITGGLKPPPAPVVPETEEALLSAVETIRRLPDLVADRVVARMAEALAKASRK